MVLAMGSHDHAKPRHMTYNDIKIIILRANVDKHAVHTARVVRKSPSHLRSVLQSLQFVYFLTIFEFHMKFIAS